MTGFSNLSIFGFLDFMYFFFHLLLWQLEFPGQITVDNTHEISVSTRLLFTGYFTGSILTSTSSRNDSHFRSR